MAFVPPQPRGRRGGRAISLSFVVDDAAASTPPLFATSPRPPCRKHHRIYGREYLVILNLSPESAYLHLTPEKNILVVVVISKKA
jgi:hypothetical protein